MHAARRFLLRLAAALPLAAGAAGANDEALPPPPAGAKLAFAEDWGGGRIDPAKWYVLSRQWGQGNHGVVPANVWIEPDVVGGRTQNVLVCAAHGDLYEGPVTGSGGQKTRTGGVIVTKPFFASGRFEVVMKIGAKTRAPGGPEDPRRPCGAVPSIWTYAYRLVPTDGTHRRDFFAAAPLYNPYFEAYGKGCNEYSSEMDFPEIGKGGDFARALYTTYCHRKSESKLFDTPDAADGSYHTYTTEWRTELAPLPGVTDAQVREAEGFWWVCDRSIPFESYLGHALKRLGPDRYAVYRGTRATHWLDGARIGENTRYIPAMAAQLDLGVWLPGWGGPAPWQTSRVSCASVRVWQYGDPGDVWGIMTNDIGSNIRPPAAGAADGPAPQRYERTARASAIDPRARAHPEIDFRLEKDGKPADVEHASVDTRVAPRGRLVIWLMGHSPALFERLNGYGLHAIQVHYANGWFSRFGQEPPPPDDQFLGKIRLEAATGEDFSDAVSIPQPDGMMERALQFVKWLAKENPPGRWEQFLADGGQALRWDRVIMAGSSHGSTTAARFAKHQRVDRVVMFCGPRDQHETWQALPSATPTNRYFGFSHVLDGGWTGHHYDRSWELLGLAACGPVVDVDQAKPPYGHTRRLVTAADVKGDARRAHSAVTPGGAAVKDAAGAFIHEDVWRYLFTEPVN